MDAIKSYIDHMFKALPATADVKRAKTDLLQMSEDRYAELRESGVSEHEAVGRVITQFGSLDEVADELGIRAQVDGLADGEVEMSDEEAERFLALHRRASWFIGAGVLVILLGVATLVWLTELSPVDGDRAEVLALIPMFTAVAIGVSCFLAGGVPLQRFNRYEDRGIVLTPQATEHYRAVRNQHTPWFIAGLAGGIAAILAAVLVMIITPVVLGLGEDSAVGVPYGMVLIGLGVVPIIVAAMRRGALGRLAREGDYAGPSPADEPGDKLIERLAGPYWMLAFVVYLSWSLIGDAWDRSWLVWPIAGVTFGLIAVTVQSIAGATRD